MHFMRSPLNYTIVLQNCVFVTKLYLQVTVTEFKRRISSRDAVK